MASPEISWHSKAQSQTGVRNIYFEFLEILSKLTQTGQTKETFLHI